MAIMAGSVLRAFCCNSYVFQGNFQTLDHMLVSSGLETVLVPGSFDVVHVNAEFADQASDHDPQVATLLLPVA
jgi:hypothetical protein